MPVFIRSVRMTKGTRMTAPLKPTPSSIAARSELAAALASCRSAFLGVGLISGVSNVLMLTGAFFMLQIYDRVLPSGSVPTLVALAILAAGLFTAQGLLDLMRGRVLVRIGAALDEDLSARVYDTIVRLPLKSGNRGDGLQPLRDLDAVRAFLSGLGPTALFDLPWMPVYLAIIFAFHTMLGLTALVGAVVLVGLTILTEVLTRAPTAAASGFAQARNGLAEAGRRNAEVLTAMGMAGRMGSRWREANQNYMASQRRVSDVAGGFGSFSKALRMMLQSAVLGVGAYLVINQEATAGIIIAGSILAGRALAPVELARVRGGAPELAAPEQATRAAAGTGGADGAACAARQPVGGKRQRHSARQPESRRAGCGLYPQSWPRPRRHRSERLGQVVAGADAGRRVAAGARTNPPRRRGA
jgi:ABC-type protease/lipase transport system fused ATPase/permease subunit